MTLLPLRSCQCRQAYVRDDTSTFTTFLAFTAAHLALALIVIAHDDHHKDLHLTND